MANPERERALTGSTEQTTADTAGSGEISLQSLSNLMSGKTLRDIKAVHQGVTADLSEARQVVEQLHQGTSEEVVNALRTILALDHTTRQQEYPALQQFVNRAKPSHYHTPLVRAALQADVPIWLIALACHFVLYRSGQRHPSPISWAIAMRLVTTITQPTVRCMRMVASLCLTRSIMVAQVF